ncbi:hypothetical protein D3C87_259410 [compost metagenome]
MAKIVKKKPAAKAASKPVKKAAAKPASKSAPKKAAAKPVVKKKVAAKAPAKPAPKKAAKPAPVKAAPKKVEAKPKAEKELKGKKAAAAPATTEKKADKKSAPSAPEKAAPSKKEAKATAAANKKTKAKKDEAELEDDFISDDDFGHDEIGEYEEELKSVEEADEEIEITEEWVAEERAKGDEEVFLTDAEGNRYCRARDCDQIAVVDAYCRYHYLMFWKHIQVRKKILMDGKLERYVEELTSRYPDKFLEMIRRDLRTEKDFLGAIQELEIDESATDNEFEEDNSAFIEEVRGMGEGSGSSVEEDDY